MNIKIINDGDIKKKIIFLIFFILVVLAFYFFILNKLFYIFEMKDRIKNTNIHISTLKREEKRVDEKIEFLRTNMTVLSKEKKMSYLENIPFRNINNLEFFIEKYLEKNNLFLKVIGRLEEDDSSNKIYIPYEIFGKIENLLAFIYDLESVMADISFGETPFSIKLEGQSMFQGKIKSSIDANKKVLNGNFCEILQGNWKDKNISQLKILHFNKKKYIIVRYFEGEKSVFLENQQLTIGNKNYRVLIKENGIYLKEDSGEQK